MRFIGIILLATLAILLTSCGGGGGRNVLESDFPDMTGTFTYLFDVTTDTNSVVGTLVDAEFIMHLTTTVDGENILAYDDFGRVYSGTFSNTEGDFTITTDDPWQHRTVEITISGLFDEVTHTGDGTFTMYFMDGFGDDDGAQVSGTWLSERV